ncbi:MAG: GNAT family N-acetyltransferase [Rhizobiaceae bacterium]|nr:GNAT family N-acetyltransferase [Rhizobiaceae bacterium]
MTQITLRPAAIEDVAAIVALHVSVWRATYRTLVSDAVFAALDEAYREARWKAALTNPGRDQLVLLAEQGERLVGIGAVGAPSHEAFGGRGEIRFLYVDATVKRQGIGRRLMRELARHLADLKYPGAALGVVAGNDPAIAFYSSLGGTVIGSYVNPGPIWPSEDIVMVWDDLSLLA